MPGLHDQLQSKLLPGFTTGHTRYVQFIKDEFKDGCRWLDAGGGRRIFPDLEDGERDLVRRANIVTVCDADPLTLKDHVSVSNLIYCDLANIPLSSNSMDFITCAMVVEHLSSPTACLGELARILCVGGRLIIHTPNLWGYPTVLARLSKIIPPDARRKAISKITGRCEEDIFPTYYRCNRDRTISSLLDGVGLAVEEIRYLNHGPLFKSFLPAYALELSYIKLTSLTGLRWLRGQLLVVATKRRSRDRVASAAEAHSLSAAGG
jgi:SAM-dependent methyltransferase